jgi:hypothetical protein
MSKRTVFTTLTPLPVGIGRETVRESLKDHSMMIDLNPLVEERHPIKPPNNATAEEYHCAWYSLTDKVQYLPGGMMSGKVSYNACFHDLENGLQTHVYAPMGLNIKSKWTLGGTLPGEPVAPVELGLGAPMQGLWLREDVDMKCNILMTSFVKKTLKKAHSKLVERLLVKAQIVDAAMVNQQLMIQQMATASQAESIYQDSDYDYKSIHSDSPNSPPFDPRRLAQSSPPSDYPSFRDRSNEDGLTPRPLSVRSSSPSYSGSFTSSQTSHSSNPDQGQRINAGNRLSWNHLNQGRVPSVNNNPPYPQGNSYQHQKTYSLGGPSLSSFAAELSSEERGRQGLKPMPQSSQYVPYRGPTFGAVELE